ncbi:MAG: hypothetical protein ACP5M1_12090 [Acidiphilium sp.]
MDIEDFFGALSCALFENQNGAAGLWERNGRIMMSVTASVGFLAADARRGELGLGGGHLGIDTGVIVDLLVRPRRKMGRYRRKQEGNCT